MFIEEIMLETQKFRKKIFRKIDHGNKNNQNKNKQQETSNDETTKTVVRNHVAIVGRSMPPAIGIRNLGIVFLVAVVIPLKLN